MAVTSSGYWYPTFPTTTEPAFGSGEVLTGAGAPDNANGQNGDVYVNISTGDIYTKSGDVWTVVSGGAGSIQVIPGAVDDPNVGLITPDDQTKGALYYKNGAPIQFWRWDTVALTWRDLITT